MRRWRPTSRERAARMRFQRPVILLGASAVAALGFWMAQDVEERLEGTAQPSPDAPEYYLDHFTATVTDTEGQLMYRLSGERLISYQRDGSSEVILPVVVFHHAQRPDWTLTSETGWISPRHDEVHLLGAVHMQRPAGVDLEPVEIHTRDVTVWPQPQVAVTDQFVHMTSTFYEAQGVGMEADILRGTLALRNQARGIYVP
jgi:lipopolysaccharide export system protein LptC